MEASSEPFKPDGPAVVDDAGGRRVPLGGRGRLIVHDRDCRLVRAATGVLGAECAHGRAVCPLCDPCLCTPKEKKWG